MLTDSEKKAWPGSEGVSHGYILDNSTEWTLGILSANTVHGFCARCSGRCCGAFSATQGPRVF